MKIAVEGNIDITHTIKIDGMDEIRNKLNLILSKEDKIISQGESIMANLTALEAEINEIKASVDVANTKMDELRQLIKDLGDAPTQEQIDALTAKLNEAQEALQHKVDEAQP